MKLSVIKFSTFHGIRGHIARDIYFGTKTGGGTPEL